MKTDDFPISYLEMGKQSGRTLAGHLVDSLLEKHPSKNEVPATVASTRAGDQTSRVQPDVDLHLEEPTEQIQLNEDQTSLIPIVPKDNSVRTGLSLPPRGHSEPPLSASAHIPTGTSAKPEAHLAHAETLRIAQDRIAQLETEIEKLRRENDQLSSAGELLHRKVEEQLSLKERFDRQKTDLEAMLAEERTVFRSTLAAKEHENQSLRLKVEELELRLENDFRRIRVRERDLEHRLEMLKLENATTARSKDELILDLKRRIDQLTTEAENYRQKGQELYRNLDERQETMRRVVRALRIALSIIEGEDEGAPLKKVD